MATAASRLAVVASLLAPAIAMADAPHHTLLYYTAEYGGVTNPMVASKLRPVRAYVTDGVARDWLFDSMIVYSYYLYEPGSSGALTSAWDDYNAALFADGGLAHLAQTVEALRAALSDPTYRLMIYFCVPYYSGRSSAPVNADIDAIVARFDGLNLPQLRLAGFYWGERESLGPASSEPGIVDADRHIKAMGRAFDLMFIPYGREFTDSNNPTLPLLTNYGINYAALQIGYFNTVGQTTAVFDPQGDAIRSLGLSGPELEFGPPDNTSVPGATLDARTLNSAHAYFSFSDYENWTHSAWTAYTHARLFAQYGADAVFRPIYDGAWQNIAANPRRTVAPRLRIVASEDSWTETASGTVSANHGSSPHLVVGTNGVPNALTAWMRFPLGSVPAGAIVTAAYVSLWVEDFPTGSPHDVAGTELHLVAAPWSEATLTGASAPAISSQPLTWHRFTGTGPHTLLATGAVSDALASGASDISFALKPAATTVDQEAELAARESATASQRPALEIVYYLKPSSDGGIVSPDAGGQHWDGGGSADGGAMPDAGADSGTAGADAAQPDGSPAADAGAAAATRGCGCTSGGGSVAGLLAATALLAGRGRRRRA